MTDREALFTAILAERINWFDWTTRQLTSRAEALAKSPHLTRLAALLVDADTPGSELLRDRFGPALHAVDDSIPF